MERKRKQIFNIKKRELWFLWASEEGRHGKSDTCGADENNA